MKSNPVVPGGSLTSKPTWFDTLPGCPTASAFFVACGDTEVSRLPRTNPMDKSDWTQAQQIAQAAKSFEQQMTGHRPKSVTVVLSDDVLVITLHGALSEAEKAQVMGGTARRLWWPQE